ncbi:peptidoglycan-binding domain-containing protein [Natronosporangium hydrolyticum]
MQAGAQGNHVAALQRTLVNCYGQNTGGIDGIWGSATTTALRNAQRSAGVSVDGIYGPQTRNAFRWAVYLDGSFWDCVPYSQLGI